MELSLSSSSSSLRLYSTTSSCFTKPSPHIIIINPKSNLFNTLFKSPDSSSSSIFKAHFSTTTRRTSTLISNKHPTKSFTTACSQVEAAKPDPPLSKVADFKDAFWRFLRPHTIRGTALGSVSLVTRALLEYPNLIRWSLVFKALSGLVALICENGYIV